jgi:hypothetical protein
MRRRVMLQALSLLAGGCAAPGGEVVSQPAAGSITAGAAYPPVGARWKVRVTEAGFFHKTVNDRDVIATSVDFNGRRGYGLASLTTTKVLDPATFNPIGLLKDGKVVVVDVPNSGRFSWPLWVGKAWSATTSHTDFSYGESWPSTESDAWVAAFEDVAVPAGTFKAFRIEYQGGIGSSVPDSWLNGVGRLGFESNDIYWYAPGPKVIVKSEVVRLSRNYQWPGRTTVELLSVPA